MKSNKGFSFIEVVVSVVLVGALTAISISQYAKYTFNAKNAVANSNLKSYMISQESFYIDQDKYSNCANKSECQVELPSYIGDDHISLDAGSEIRWGETTPGQSYYLASVNHIEGNKSFKYTNKEGSSDIIVSDFPHS